MINELAEANAYLNGENINPKNLYRTCYLILKWYRDQGYEESAARDALFAWGTGLYCPDVDLVIDYVSYRRIADFLQKVHRLKKQPEKAGNAFTKKMLIRLDEEDHARQAREPFQSKLGNLMSAACNMPGFKYNYQEIQQLPMGAFIDSVIRLQIIKNAEQLISGIYAGTIDSKKINKKKLDWTRPLEAGE